MGQQVEFSFEKFVLFRRGEKEEHDRMGLRVWAIVAAALGCAAGVPGGVGAYTFWYARGASYLTNDPAACANCHVMQSYYDGWLKSSHHKAAVCNDCHTPHDFFGKYLTKAINGHNHSVAFTLGGFHEPIQITPRNHAITEEACRRCHADIVQAIDRTPAHGSELSCTNCHRNAGHPH